MITQDKKFALCELAYGPNLHNKNDEALCQLQNKIICDLHDLIFRPLVAKLNENLINCSSNVYGSFCSLNINGYQRVSFSFSDDMQSFSVEIYKPDTMLEWETDICTDFTNIDAHIEKYSTGLLDIISRHKPK